MGNVQVALVGPSAAAVQARLAEIAATVGAQLSHFNATAGFDTNGSSTIHKVTSALLSQSTSDDELVAQLLPFQDEIVDPQVGVRFMISPEDIQDPLGPTAGNAN